MATTDQELTIDELARATGMTVRNIRAHQGRGLLPPPEVRARTGFYGPVHVERLRLIRDMQAEGYNLKAIERLLQGDGGAEHLLRFGRAARDAFLDEEPELATAAELTERLGPLTAKELAKVAKLGLVRDLGDGRIEILSPTLLRAGEELVALGIPVAHALAVAATVQRQSRQIAAAFVRLFVVDVLDEGDEDAASWEQRRVALERLRPLAAEAVQAAFQLEMGREVERELARRVRR